MQQLAPRSKAVLYRMVMPDHLCPFGVKSKYLLEKEGYEVEDHWLTTREETDAFMERIGVETTPQTWIEGERIGGYDALRDFFHFSEASRFRPVLALFAVAALMAVAVSLVTVSGLGWRTVEFFVAIAMVLLALQKLKNVESFSTMFLNYDLVARRWVPYGYVYPYAEAIAGLLMIAGALIWVAAPVAIVIGGIGAVSVIKAVYVDKRELTCACMGGDSDVPLGFISLTENLMMLAMGLWMGARLLI